jgi:hypothetical protein
MAAWSWSGCYVGGNVVTPREQVIRVGVNYKF